MPEPAKLAERGWTVLALIILFVLLSSTGPIYCLFDGSGCDEPILTRHSYLLGGLEAVVFTAVGWWFGRDGNRTQAEQAQAAIEVARDAIRRTEGLKQAILANTNPELAAENAEVRLAALREEAARY